MLYLFLNLLTPRMSRTTGQYLLYLVSKLFESFIIGFFLPFINPILMDEQHGFHPGWSTSTCNIIFCNNIFDTFNAHSKVDVIYTDFTKAFDRVNHYSLLKILDRTRISDTLLSWFNLFLTDRKQWVKIYGVISSPVIVPSGISQGDHLSLLLFSLFINSANQVLHHSQLLAFADDIKIFLRIDSIKMIMSFFRMIWTD